MRPAAPGYQPPAPPQKSHRKRNILLAVVGAVVLIGVIGALGSDDSGLRLPRLRLRPLRSPPLRRRPPRRQMSRLPRPGTEVRDRKFAFKVTRVQRGVSSVGDQFGEEAQGSFTIVTLRVKNIGDESQTFDASNQKAYSGSTAFEADGGASLFANEGSQSFLEGSTQGTASRFGLYSTPRRARSSPRLSFTTRHSAEEWKLPSNSQGRRGWLR